MNLDKIPLLLSISLSKSEFNEKSNEKKLARWALSPSKIHNTNKRELNVFFKPISLKININE